MASIFLLFTRYMTTHRMSFSLYIKFFQGFARLCTEEWRIAFLESIINFNLYVCLFFFKVTCSF